MLNMHQIWTFMAAAAGPMGDFSFGFNLQLPTFSSSHGGVRRVDVWDYSRTQTWFSVELSTAAGYELGSVLCRLTYKTERSNKKYAVFELLSNYFIDKITKLVFMWIIVTELANRLPVPELLRRWGHKKGSLHASS